MRRYPTLDEINLKTSEEGVAWLDAIAKISIKNKDLKWLHSYLKRHYDFLPFVVYIKKRYTTDQLNVHNELTEKYIEILEDESGKRLKELKSRAQFL